MAHWSERVETEARHIFRLLSSIARRAFESGHRRRVVGRDKAGKVLFSVSLSYVVIGALLVFFLARRVFLLALLALAVAYALGYRAEVVRYQGPR